MQMRPYQQAARTAVHREWDEGRNRTLLVLPTGCGKTIVFAKITEDEVRSGNRVLILAHRGELLQQAADKLERTSGLKCAVEKAEQTCLGQWYRVAVGSVQTLMRQKRLAQFPADYFQTIIIDEAHHAISDSYQVILNHFSGAHVLGVTATPDRGDKQNLGKVFDSLAYEYTLPQAIHEGYLTPIRALTVPIQIDFTQVGTTAGDYKPGEIATALDPYLEQIAAEMAKPWYSCRWSKPLKSSVISSVSMDSVRQRSTANPMTENKSCKTLRMVSTTCSATACCSQRAGTVRMWIAWSCCGQPKCVLCIVRWWGVAHGWQRAKTTYSCWIFCGTPKSMNSAVRRA